MATDKKEIVFSVAGILASILVAYLIYRSQQKQSAALAAQAQAQAQADADAQANQTATEQSDLSSISSELDSFVGGSLSTASANLPTSTETEEIASTPSDTNISSIVTALAGDLSNSNIPSSSSFDTIQALPQTSGNDLSTFASEYSPFQNNTTTVTSVPGTGQVNQGSSAATVFQATPNGNSTAIAPIIQDVGAN